MTEFSQAQLDALATATLMARNGVGFTINAERAADRATCDGLVESGHMVAIEGVDGGYRLSDEYAAALGIDAARQAEAARSN